MENEIDTDLSHYTINDIFSLLDINITADADYNDVKKEIISKTNKYIEKFDLLKNPKISHFFKSIQEYLTKDRDTNSSIVQDPRPHGPNMGGSTNQTETTNGISNISYNSNDGAGNPINRKTITKLLNIDSRNRDPIYPSSTDFMINLQYPINNVIEMKLCDLELPTTYYPISSALDNNYMWIKVYKNNGPPQYYYVFIPDGYYYYDDLISYINSTKCLNSPIFAVNPIISIKFDLSYKNLGGVGTGTGKVTLEMVDLDKRNVTSIELNFAGNSLENRTTTFMVTDPEEIVRYNKLDNANIQLKFGWLLGYRKSTYTGEYGYISESVMDIIGPRYLFLIIRDGTNGLNTNVNFISSTGNGLDGDTIARISIKGSSFNVQVQNDFSVYTEPRYYYGLKKIEKISVKLVDEYKRVLDLNQNDFSFTLRLTTVYSNS
uniref:Uncharacterized protein n=1 Tax=viral metagenome TaxID=1070528 RepID=A0A6C0JLX2_9ZZZZ